MSNNKYKVLIVEDEANICSFIETLLTTNDYQALVAHTCTMGLTPVSYTHLDVYKRQQPDRAHLWRTAGAHPAGPPRCV